MYRSIFILLFLLLQLPADAQSPIDVLQYKFSLQLTDASDTLKGTANITVRFLENTKQFSLNLASVKNGKGMQVLSVMSNGKTFSNTHATDTLFIYSEPAFQKDSAQTFSITYAGIPADGLIISRNKYNDRTFFADNWPNRAHHWIPCNDQPADKAPVEFEVTAPAQYSVISNGALIGETVLPNNQKFTRWKEAVPIPTKVMTLGVARFAVKQFNDSTIIPVSAWVYPQDSTKGFYDYALAPGIVKFFTGYIGPYPFEKLANVQSKTIFGGLENASAIFYGENTITGNGKPEALIAHEIAHQWFGNSATETGFAHLWLSEGFATYLTHLYLEQKYGRDTLIKGLQKDRNEIIEFSKESSKPVVDSQSSFMELLNANSYQKGSWVLHMLRGEVGDTVFRTIIRMYYELYKGGNADTWGFEKVAEEVSGKELSWFFQQWLYRPGIPKIRLEKKRQGSTTTVKIIQTGTPYQLSLTIGLIGDGGRVVKQKLLLKSAEAEMKLPGINTNVLLDPDTELLFEQVK